MIVRTEGTPVTLQRESDTNFLFWIVAAAVLVRLVVMAFLYPEQLSPERDHWRFAYETGRIARSLATGHGFGSPLFSDTGPTAFLTPAYPAILAGIFKIFGVYTKASAIAMLSLQALISSLTCIPVFFCARKGFGEKVAHWSAWAWAFFPYGVYFSEERIWSTCLSTLLLSLIFLMAFELDYRSRTWSWVLFGTLFGVTALTDPVVMSVLPLLLGWISYRLYRQRSSWLKPVAISILALVATVSPWFARNYRTFHQFVPFRDTMGMELLIGNNGDTSHWRPAEIGPWHNPADWERFQKTGELAYMANDGEEAMAYIKGHKAWFAVTSVRRFLYLWTGYWSLDRNYLAQEPLDVPNIFFSTTLTILSLIGIWGAFRFDPENAFPYAAVMLCLPLVYYVTHVEVYYRRQIDPMMVVLAVYAVVRLRQKAKVRDKYIEAELQPV